MIFHHVLFARCSCYSLPNWSTWVVNRERNPPKVCYNQPCKAILNNYQFMYKQNIMTFFIILISLNVLNFIFICVQTLLGLFVARANSYSFPLLKKKKSLKNEGIALQLKTKCFLKSSYLPQQISQYNPLFRIGHAMRTAKLLSSLFLLYPMSFFAPVSASFPLKTPEKRGI